MRYVTANAFRTALQVSIDPDLLAGHALVAAQTSVCEALAATRTFFMTILGRPVAAKCAAYDEQRRIVFTRAKSPNSTSVKPKFGLVRNGVFRLSSACG